ncbi:MAG: aldo/keto reductase [Gammaproteobacteria bacterium]|jgi:L-galactose dehydrogenase|nr:aldo/keto reductase [Gammaproteobacteria bacterium]MBT5685875.1 aldo/keto reductase [Gammaproteobacteria bacterium]MBT7880614.1 aldo/keto reductase [Gammaproteobacteria bacterium]
MDHVRLGRTDLMVSPVGLGCGGYSRLGMRESKDSSTAEGVVKHALDLGINYFDTARAYGTEEVVGKIVHCQRSEVVISTKTMFRDKDGNYMPVERLVDSLEKSLARLNTDYVDVFSFHGVMPHDLDHCLEVYVPVLQQQIQLGKIRYLGITENFRDDPTHEMLQGAVPVGCFDVAMVGFNFLNSGARDRVFRDCLRHDVGTQVMHAVRRALSNPAVLMQNIEQLISTGEIEKGVASNDDPLKFLTGHPEVKSVIEAAYRYCRYEPGVSLVLTGTGSLDHLTSNVAALTAPPLPGELIEELDRIFGKVRSVSGD